MKLLLKNLLSHSFVIFLRNFFNLRKIIINPKNIDKFDSISDAFIWRTDNGYETVFRYGDLLKSFFNDKTSIVEVLIFDKNFKLIKKINLLNIAVVNELTINKDLLSGVEDFGTFYIFHKGGERYKTKIRNSCYTGYSLNQKLPSFVHGNIPTLKKNYNSISNNIIGKSFLVNQFYKLQKKIDKKMKTEIILSNPTSGKITFYVNRKRYYLLSNCTIIIEIINAETVEIVSNCYFFRPLVFTNNQSFLDVHHG